MSKEQEVIQAIADQLSINVNQIKLTSTLIEDLSADSLDLTELLMHLEEKFGVSISSTGAEMRTVGDVVSYIDQHLAQQPETVANDA